MNSSSESQALTHFECFAFPWKDQHSHSVFKAGVISAIIFNILSFPATVLLNAMVIITVKVKSRLREHKSNILLALLAFTDFVVGMLAQPLLILVLITSFIDKQYWLCSLEVISKPTISFLFHVSLNHITLLSTERFIAIKHPFKYRSLVTTSRLMIASSLAWLLSLVIHLLTPILLSLSLVINNSFIAVNVVIIVFLQVTVYVETRRHERQIGALQVTQEERRRFAREKKAFKLTVTILSVLVICFLPLVILRGVVWSYGNAISEETKYILFYWSRTITLINSLINPIIFAIRIRHFRATFLELTRCRLVNILRQE